MNRFVCIASAAGLLALAAPALGQEPNVKDILTKVDTTTKALKGVSYKAEAWVEGADADRAGRVKGTAHLKRTGDELPLFRFEITAAPPGEKPKEELLLVNDGKELLRADKVAKKFQRVKLDDNRQALAAAQPVFMQEYTHATPFSDELNGDSQKYEGKKPIQGVECHVIYIVYSGGQGEARWYFGINDNLPHRVERVIKQGGAESLRILEVADLKPDPAFDAKTFAIEAPEGFEDMSPGLLSPGRDAPAFTLKTPDGKSISLAELKGKTVVLNFWASWSNPSNTWLGAVQKLHEKYKDKNVVVLGINAADNPDVKVADFAKEKGITFAVLADGNEVAKQYRAQVPTTYVIGPGGKVVHSMSKFKADDPANEAALAKAIDKSLKPSRSVVRWLIGTILACVALAGALLWQFARAPAPFTSDRSGEKSRSSNVVNPANQVVAQPTTAPMRDFDAPVEVPFVRRSDTSRAPPADETRVPAISTVRWAGDLRRSAAHQRLEAARAAANAEPTSVAALDRAISATLELELWSETELWMGRRVVLAPDDADFRFRYATLLMRLRLWSQAAAELTQVAALTPGDGRVWFNRAVAEREAGKLRESRASWDCFLTLESDQSEARARRGEVLLDLEEWAAAEADFRLVLESLPGDVDATLNLSLAQLRQGRYAAARQTAELLLQSRPNHLAAINRVAEIARAEAHLADDAAQRQGASVVPHE